MSEFIAKGWVVPVLGLLVVFALILLRFFDEDLGFAVRGVVFVLLGLAFLAVNLVLARRKGAAS